VPSGAEGRVKGSEIWWVAHVCSHKSVNVMADLACLSCHLKNAFSHFSSPRNLNTLQAFTGNL